MEIDDKGCIHTTEDEIMMAFAEVGTWRNLFLWSVGNWKWNIQEILKKVDLNDDPTDDEIREAIYHAEHITGIAKTLEETLHALLDPKNREGILS